MIDKLEDIATCKGHTTIIWNARSLLPKIEEVERLVIKAKPDFIGITETWLKPIIDDELVQIDGYNHTRFDRTEASGKTSGGGLMWYYNDRLHCEVLTELNYCDRNIELCVIKLILTRTRAIYMGLVYRPPTGSIPEFIEKLEELITNLRARGLCEINLTGDFNIDLLKNDVESKQYKDFLKRVGLTNMINVVTHIKQLELGFSLIDHFLTTDEYLYGLTGALPTNASDHFFVFAVRKKTKN